jgi:glycine/D-amino acid oxidase-like deaminating enzyme
MTTPSGQAPADSCHGRVDVAIIGGGIAGLWLLNLLRGRGYAAVLFEADLLGAGQTLASQGMIHGGLKYALGGALSGASEAIAGMPGRWREHLAGQRAPDLSGLEPLAERYYLYAAGGSLDRLAGFFASRALRGRIEKLPRHAWPDAFGDFRGVVYGLNDFVLDTPSLLKRLLGDADGHVYHRRVGAADLAPSGDGWSISLPGARLAAGRLILAAGAGNGPLLEGLGLSGTGMQLRPLHQVLVRAPHLPDLFAHCVTGITRPEPRLTITSHPDPERAGRRLWYLGGQLATEGVRRDTAAQLDKARDELRRCVPWLDWGDAELAGFRVDRAEPAQADGRRPDEAFVGVENGCLVCWPTKLSLAPDLGERVLAALDPPDPSAGCEALPLPPAALGAPPWAD